MRTSSLLAALVVAWGSGCASSALDTAEPLSQTDLGSFELGANALPANEDFEQEDATAAPGGVAEEVNGDCDDPASDEEILSAIEAAQASAAEDFEGDFWFQLVSRCQPAGATELDDSVPSLR